MPSTRTRSRSGSHLELALEEVAARPRHRATMARSSAGRTLPTQSLRYTVWEVVGRIWPRTTNSRPVDCPGTGREQQQVGEGEVGEQAPGGGEPLEVGDARPVEVGVDPGELGEGGHEASTLGAANRRLRPACR